MPDVKPSIDDDDDDYELELEPVDPEILRLERERAQQRTESAIAKVDVNDVYGDTSQYSDLDIDLSKLRQFRFSTQHLLILTAVLAIVLTLLQLLDGTRTVVILAVVMLAGGWWWANRLERQQEEARERRRAEFYGEEVVAAAQDSLVTESRLRSTFKFAFSTKELLITTAAAAVTLALLKFFGPEYLSMTLGLIAFAGLAAYAMGYDPPRHVVLGWWILLVMYLAVGLVTVAGGDKNSVQRSPQRLDRVVIAVSLGATTNRGAIA